MRPTHAEIDLAAIRRNITALKAAIKPSILCAVIKADAYGHGDVPVAVAAEEAGAGWLAVALVEEGARLREAGIESPILVLSEPHPGDAGQILRWDLTPTVYSDSFLDALIDAGASRPVHVKVDTGMHRVGAGPGALAGLVERIERHSDMSLGALWSHFAVADEDPLFTQGQLRSFTEAVAPFSAGMLHLANTAGALLFPDARFDMCRVGLGIYGLYPSPETRDLVDLAPAMRIVSRVSHVRRLEAGSRPSYGRIRPMPRDGFVATVPIGYADGYPRRLSVGALALVGGRRRQLAGTVTMDQIVLDVTGSDVAVGDEVILMGSQGSEVLTADEWATALDTISYEVVCGIGPRVPRRYLD